MLNLEALAALSHQLAINHRSQRSKSSRFDQIVTQEWMYRSVGHSLGTVWIGCKTALVNYGNNPAINGRSGNHFARNGVSSCSATLCVAAMKDDLTQSGNGQSDTSNAEHMLRVLHGHLKRKRDGIRELAADIQALAERGRIEKGLASDLRERLLALVRREDELTWAERQILERDSQIEARIRHHYPAMPNHLVVVCICIVDGLSTTEIASVVCKSVKAVDHYRQEIRQIVGLHGDRSSLQRHLLSVIR
jgi:hypothetical protein